MKIELEGYNGKSLDAIIKGEAKSLGLKLRDISRVSLSPQQNGIGVAYFSANVPRGIFDDHGNPITEMFLSSVFI